MISAERDANGCREDGLEAARASFYEGEIADAIVRYHEEHGGYLRRDDLAEFRSRYEPVVATRWRDFTLYTCGPWCQGPVLAEALLILDEVGIDGMVHNSPAYVHTVIEVLKAAFADREHHFGDPDFVDVPLERILGADHASHASRRAIDPDRAHPGMPPQLFGESQPLPDPMLGHRGAPHRRGRGTSLRVRHRPMGQRVLGDPVGRGVDGAGRSPVPGSCRRCADCSRGPDPAHPSGVGTGRDAHA